MPLGSKYRSPSFTRGQFPCWLCEEEIQSQGQSQDRRCHFNFSYFVILIPVCCNPVIEVRSYFTIVLHYAYGKWQNLLSVPMCHS